MPPGNRGLGGIPIPPRHHQQSRPDVDPLTALIDEPLVEARIREAAEDLVLPATEKAREAKSVAENVKAKLDILIAISGTTLAMAVGAFVWLFSQQQVIASKARLEAQQEAKTVVLESREAMLQTLRSERDEDVRAAVKRTLAEQGRIFAAQKDPDRITPN